MKTFMPIIICTVMLFASCGNSQTGEKEQPANTTDQAAEQNNADEAKNCDEFIDQYEKWMDNYLEMIEKYMKNPMDATLSADYMKLAQEGADWMTQWNGKLYYCASKEKYQKRFDQISKKAEKKLNEMGIE